MAVLGLAALCVSFGLPDAVAADAHGGGGGGWTGAAPAALTERRTEPPYRLWYTEPATSWEREGLPVGNGSLGGVVFGGVNLERLQFNEKTLWTGGPAPGREYTNGNWTSPRPHALAEARRLIDEQVRVDPEPITKLLGQPKVGYGSYSTFGEIRLDFGDLGPARDYVRDLTLDEGVASVSFEADGVRYRRELFASYPDQVLVTRLTADQPGALTFTLSQTVPAGRRDTQVTRDGARLTVAGSLDDNGLRFESQLHVTAEGGTVGGTATTVTVTGADAVTIVLAAGTDYADEYPTYRGEDPHAQVTATVDAAAAKPYAELRAAHVADVAALFDRLRLDLGQELPDIPTDELLRRYGEGTLEPAHARYLEALYTQYGRYLLIGSSRPGSLPANLQGVWAEGTSNPWGADYHVNINLQMNYWLAEVTNLAETTPPLHEFIDALRAPGRVSAREMFDADGWVVQNETNPFGYTGVHDWPTAFWFPEAGAWLTRHLWEHYLFTLDRDFLAQRAYPVMKEAAEFWLDFFVEDPRDGTLVVSPSYSPEHGPYTAGAAMSQQIVWDLLTNTIAAGEELGVDAAFRERLRETRDRLDPGLRIGSWGQLQEWKVDIDDPTNDHRHVSHLYALHPGSQISPRTTPEYAEAARVSLRARGDGGTGWSKAWKINFWARLLDGDHAHTMLREQLTHSTLPNLWDTHPPFQIDGNFGGTAGVAEMLVQSHLDAIDVLPALPRVWRNGSVDGLRARGAFTVGVTWREGAVTEVRLQSDKGRDAVLRHEAFRGPVRVYRADGRAAPFRVEGDRIVLPTKAGASYRVVRQAVVATDGPTDVVRPGSRLSVEVTVAANDRRAVPATRVRLEAPEGWSVSEAVQLPPARPGRPATALFTVDVPADVADGEYVLTARVASGDWTVSSRVVVDVARENLALRKATTQSSTAFGGDSARAVDGNTSGVWSAGSVTHTDFEPEAWWQVDLGAVTEIDEIRLWNRTDCCAERLTDFYVHVSDQPFASTSLAETLADPDVWSYHHEGTAGTPSVVEVGRAGRYIRVQLAGENALSLAEVQVYGR
jgi:alpha-L-fucosidase 2